MILSTNFTLEELTFSQTAVRKGIDNTPDVETLENLQMLANGLERVRHILGTPIIISSGYRSPKLNAAVGGSHTSQHMFGLAADFTSPRFGSPLEICNELKKQANVIQFDQLINEGSWVHISFSDNPRNQVLTAVFENGKVRYMKGIV